MPRVRLLGTGGTIAGRSGSSGRTPQLSAAELLASVGPLPPGISVEPVDVAAAPSFALTLDDLRQLAGVVRQALDEGCDGVVITHGTDSMEETAFYLDLLQHDPRPVVLTGAQRPADSAAPDGPANLADAIRVAASEAARACGVLLVFDGVGWAARGVQKVDTLSTVGFGAPGRGPVLRSTAAGVTLFAVPDRPALPGFDLDRPLPRVDIVPAYLGVDDTLLQAALAAGARGIVVAAFGAGNTPPALTRTIADVVGRGVPVLICSRVPSGPVEALYGGGGGTDLLAAGALFGGDLTPWQGRLLLAAALATGADPASALDAWTS